jgi:hypothetical protein
MIWWGAAKLLLLAAVVPLGMACTEGYPKRDVETLHPLDMSNTQRVEAMNRLGKEAVPDRTWAYALQSNCVLRVTTGKPGQDRVSVTVPLKGATGQTSFDRERKLYGFSLKVSDTQAPEGVLLLESRSWSDTVEMNSLLKALQLGCQDSTAVAAGV